MKIRTLEEIERDETGRGAVHPAAAPVPTMADLRPGPVKRLFLGVGDLLLALPRFVWRLFVVSLDIAFILGILGCVIFGLVYLFG